MKAEETVMNDNQVKLLVKEEKYGELVNPSTPIHRMIREAQAEITWDKAIRVYKAYGIPIDTFNASEDIITD